MKKNKANKEVYVLVQEITHHKRSFVGITVLLLLCTAWLFLSNTTPTAIEDTSAAACTSSPCETDFRVNVQDSLSVSLTTPSSSAVGNVDTFLRNTVNLSVTSNVTNGFTASMYSSSSNASSTKTDLAHTTLGSSYVIPTLASSTKRSSFPSNYWGYSLKSASLDGKTYGETDPGSSNSYYYPLTASTASPIIVLSAASGTKNGTQSIYFGAKASIAKASGTYSNTVVFNVVTGAIDTNNPITPTNPVTPSVDVPNNSTATYTGSTGTGATQGVGISGSTGTTVYTTTSNSTTNTTNTTVSGGDVTSTYQNAQGVQSTKGAAATEASAMSGSEQPVALAVAAGTLAAAGVAFFVLAKKRDDDDDDEEA